MSAAPTKRRFLADNFVPSTTRFSAPSWPSRFGHAGTAERDGKDAPQVVRGGTQLNDPFWQAGLADGDLNDDRIANVALEPEPTRSFQPSQAEINAFISMGAASEMLFPGIVAPTGTLVMGGDLSGIVSARDPTIQNRRWILDGHHRWLAVFLISPCLAITGRFLDAPLSVLHPVLMAAGDQMGNPRNYAGPSAANAFRLARQPADARARVLAGYIRVLNLGRLEPEADGSWNAAGKGRIALDEAVTLHVAETPELARTFLIKNTKWRKVGDGDRLIHKIGLIRLFQACHTVRTGGNADHACTELTRLLSPPIPADVDAFRAHDMVRDGLVRVCLQVLGGDSQSRARVLQDLSLADDAADADFLKDDTTIRDRDLYRIGMNQLVHHFDVLRTFDPSGGIVARALKDVYGDQVKTPNREGMPVIESELDLFGRKSCKSQVGGGGAGGGSDLPADRQCQLDFITDKLRAGHIDVYQPQ